MGKKKVTVTTWNADGTKTVDTVEMDIDKIMEGAPEAEPDFWCQCKESYETDFYDDEYDEDDNLISKHHYRCKNCVKVTQIG